MNYIRKLIAIYSSWRLKKFVESLQLDDFAYPIDLDKHDVIYSTRWWFERASEGYITGLFNVPKDFTGIVVYRYKNAMRLTFEYFKNGKNHRDVYPAIMTVKLKLCGLDYHTYLSDSMWYQDSQKHNLHGPATMIRIGKQSVSPSAKVIGNHYVEYYIYGNRQENLIEFTQWAKNSGIAIDGLTEEDENLIKMRWKS